MGSLVQAQYRVPNTKGDNKLKFEEEFELLNSFPDDSFLNEMAQIGKFNRYTAFVNTNDPGHIPHFHLWDSNSKGVSFHTRIKITSPEYFHHHGKEGVLNSKDRKELCEFLLLPSEDGPVKTNWEVLLIEWNRNNSDNKVDPKTPMPDYSLLKG